MATTSAPKKDSADPLHCSLPPGRHGLPKEFIAANQRARLLTAFRALVVTKGYCATTIQDICSTGALSRRTFYEHFGSKEAMAEAVMKEALAKTFPLDGFGVAVVELLALAEDALPEDAAEMLEHTRRYLAGLKDTLGVADGEESEEVLVAPLHRKPSPARLKERPRLPKEFVQRHVKQRLLNGTSQVIAERGYGATRVSDIVTASKMARNTFYENFGSKAEATQAMARFASPYLDETFPDGLDLDRGLGVMLIELVATRQAKGPEVMGVLIGKIQGELDLVESHLEELAG